MVELKIGMIYASRLNKRYLYRVTHIGKKFVKAESFAVDPRESKFDGRDFAFTVSIANAERLFFTPWLES